MGYETLTWARPYSRELCTSCSTVFLRVTKHTSDLLVIISDQGLRFNHGQDGYLDHKMVYICLPDSAELA